MKKCDLTSALATRLAIRQGKWLQEEFSRVALDRAGDEGTGRITLSLPTLFSLQAHCGKGFHVRGILRPVEVAASSPDEAVALLFERIMKSKGPLEQVVEYVPRAGQPVLPDWPYRFVRHNDPEHDHGSPRLIHLLPVDPVHEYKVERGSLDTGNHYHLLIPG